MARKSRSRRGLYIKLGALAALAVVSFLIARHYQAAAGDRQAALDLARAAVTASAPATVKASVPQPKLVHEADMGSYHYFLSQDSVSKKYIALFQPTMLPRSDGPLMQALTTLIKDAYGDTRNYKTGVSIVTIGGKNFLQATGEHGTHYFFYSTKNDAGETYSLVFYKQ